jgi:hypothetical protein
MLSPHVRPRVASIAVCAVLLSSLAGCGSDSSSEPEPRGTGSPSPGTQPKRPVPDWSEAATLPTRTLAIPDRSVCEADLAPAGANPGDWYSLALEHSVEPTEPRLGSDPELVLRHFEAGRRGASVVLDRGPGLAAPQLAVAGDGRVACVWESRDAAGTHVVRAQSWTWNRDSWSAHGEPRDLGGVPDPEAGDADFAAWIADSARRGGARPVLPRIAWDPAGRRAVCVWQGLVGEQYDLFVSSGDWERGLGPARRLTSTPTDEGSPDVTWSADGALFVGFDRWEPGDPAQSDSGSYDVWLARFELPEVAGAPTDLRFRRLDGGPNHAAHARVSAGPDGDLWIAYERAATFGTGNALRWGLGPVWLHVDAADRWSADSANVAANVSGDRFPHTGHFPEVLATASGPWLAVRVWRPDEAESRSGQTRALGYADWETLVGCWDAAGRIVWRALPDTHGDNTARFTLQARGDATQVAGSADTRHEAVRTQWYERPMETPWQLGWSDLPAAHTPALAPAESVEPWREALPESAPNARRPDALFGDLHRHTHLSRCGSSLDGTFLDAVRYARGPGALDFMAVTDHYQHLQPWSFWRLVRDAERWSAPGSLVVFPGIESMERGRGHQNLIWATAATPRASAGAFLPKDYAIGDVVAIPHMLNSVSNPFNDEALHAGRHRLIEVYQGLRGSYEEPEAPYAAEDALLDHGHLLDLLARFPANRRPPGLIAASDHRSSLDAFAGVPWTVGDRRVPPAEVVFEELLGRTPQGSTVFAATGFGPAGAAGAPCVRLEARAAGEGPWSLEVDGPPVAHVAWRSGRGDLALQAPELPEDADEVRRYHLRYRGPERWTGESLELSLLGGAWVDIEGNAASIAEGGAQRRVLELSRETLGLSLHVRRDPEAADLRLEVQMGSRQIPFALDGFEPGTVRLGGGGADDARAIQLWHLGPVGSSNAAGGAQRFEWTPPPESRGELIYARVAFADGSVVWTPARRSR